MDNSLSKSQMKRIAAQAEREFAQLKEACPGCQGIGRAHTCKGPAAVERNTGSWSNPTLIRRVKEDAERSPAVRELLRRYEASLELIQDYSEI